VWWGVGAMATVAGKLTVLQAEAGCRAGRQVGEDEAEVGKKNIAIGMYLCFREGERKKGRRKLNKISFII